VSSPYTQGLNPLIKLDYKLKDLLSITSRGSLLKLVPQGFQQKLNYKRSVYTKNCFSNKQITQDEIQRIHLEKYMKIYNTKCFRKSLI
jgi:hypothetical protein